MISNAMRRSTTVAAAVILACLIAVTTAAAVSAHSASQPSRRQIAVATLTDFRVVLTATRGGPGHKLQATVTASGFRRSGGRWKLIATKGVGTVNEWFWFSVEPCSLGTTQLKNNVKPSPPVIAFDSMKVSLLITPAIGCSSTFSERWRP
jgi:hypothetical protein